jgi:hypothetical protein
MKRTLPVAIELLEDRVTPSVTAPTVDLSTHAAIGEINGALFQQADAQPTGSGVIHSFVRLQAQGAKQTAQQGYNTDARPVQFDENTSPTFTRALRLGDVPTIDIGGVTYREFLLDINQKASQPFLSLDEVRVFVGSVGNLNNYNSDSHQLNNLNAVYDMDAGGVDNWVKLNARLNQGSGKGDMRMYVPDSVFAGANDNSYLYLYSRFGLNFTANAGFEEWAVNVGGAQGAGVGGTSGSGLGSITGLVSDASGNPLVDVVIFLDTNGNGVLDSNELYTVTDSTGHYTFDNLGAGFGDFSTYHVTQLAPTDYSVVGPISWDVTLSSPGQVQTVNFTDTLSQPPPPSDGLPNS